MEKETVLTPEEAIELLQKTGVIPKNTAINGDLVINGDTFKGQQSLFLDGVFKKELVIEGTLESDLYLSGIFKNNICMGNTLECKKGISLGGIFEANVFIQGTFEQAVLITGTFRREVIIGGTFYDLVITGDDFEGDVFMERACYKGGFGAGNFPFAMQALLHQHGIEISYKDLLRIKII